MISKKVMPQLRVKTDICTAPRRGPYGKAPLRRYISEAELRGMIEDISSRQVEPITEGLRKKTFSR